MYTFHTGKKINLHSPKPRLTQWASVYLSACVKRTRLWSVEVCCHCLAHQGSIMTDLLLLLLIKTINIHQLREKKNSRGSLLCVCYSLAEWECEVNGVQRHSPGHAHGEEGGGEADLSMCCWTRVRKATGATGLPREAVTIRKEYVSPPGTTPPVSNPHN